MDVSDDDAHVKMKIVGSEIVDGRRGYLSATLAHLEDQAAALERQTVEASSERTYASLMKKYLGFCGEHALEPYAAESVRYFVAERVAAQERIGTIRSRLAAIRRSALAAGLADPTDDAIVRKPLRGAGRERKREPRRVAPATFEALERLVAATESIASAQMRSGRAVGVEAMLVQMRDRALVLLGFALGRRGSELARVEVSDIERHPEGILVKIPWTKTNKTGEPEYVGVPSFPGDPLCPIHALDAWLAAAKITSGPVFVTLSPVVGRGRRAMRGEDISRRIAAIASEAGLEGLWRSHSLRRGVVTSAEARGVARSRTRLLTGWSSEAMFPVYADHRNKIRASPLHDMFGNIEHTK